KYEVSANGGANGKRNVLFGYYDEDGRPCFNESVSSNVFTVPQKGKNAADDGTRLIVLYQLASNRYENGEDADPLPFYSENLPIIFFDGKRVGTKETAKEKDRIRLAAALVKYDSTTGAVSLIANSASLNGTGAKAKPMLELSAKAKNNLYATVSGSYWRDDITGVKTLMDCISENNYIKKKTERPYFTVKVKVNDDKNKTLKDYKSRINKAVTGDGTPLKKAQFRFEIVRNEFAYMNDVSASVNMAKHALIDHTDGYNPYLAQLVSDNSDATAVNYLHPVKDTEKVKIKGTDGDIKVCLYTYLFKKNKKTGKYENTGKPSICKLIKSGKTGETNTKKGDYTTSVITDPSGSSEGILVLTPCGNFEGDAATFRTVTYTNEKGVEVTETRGGVYENEQNWYVYNVE
nr:hypothetical protein [Lachnospiraceae bacterium]